MKVHKKYGTLSPIGIDIRSSGVYAVQLEKLKGTIQIHSYASIPFDAKENLPAGVSPIVHALTLLRTTCSFSGHHIITSMPRGEVDMRPLKLPAGMTIDSTPPEILQEEARSMLTYSAENAVLSFMPLSSELEDGKVRDTVLLVAAKRENVNRHLALLKSTGLDCVCLDVGPCAAARFNGCNNLTHANIDIDRNRTVVSIAQGSNVLFARTLKLGWQRFVEEISNKLCVNETEATDMLQTYGIDHRHVVRHDLKVAGETGLLNPDSIPAAIFEICNRVFGQFAKEIKRSFDYYTMHNHGKVIEKAFIIGSIIPKNLDAYLSANTTIPIHLANLSIQFDQNSSPLMLDGCAFVTAAGLALRGIKA